MPAIVGPVQINTIANGNLLFGDAAVISPKAATKTIAGSGSFSTGALIFTGNGLNGNNVLDVNGIDQPITANN
ncbi:spore germination protein [Bacillus massiliglaciei]|uniref:spore germination protein n=1 Tax=Bacillus massiliglaciei TaxID=1816693 RepID=UPI000DA639A7|nr:spore germination protein [Bacillus massiliglaciei]